jgi:transposase
MTVIVERDDGVFDRTRRLGLGRFERPVRREFTRRGGLRPCLRIVRKLFVALADPAGVLAHRSARWSGCSCCWRTGVRGDDGWPRPKPG